MLFRMIQLPSDEPVTFVGCYVLKWGRSEEPTVAFVPATEEEINEAWLEKHQETDDN